MVAIQRNIVELQMDIEELDELNEFLDKDGYPGDLICPSLIDEEWLNDFGLFFNDYRKIDFFRITLKE